jgi:hypothetical protein
MGDNTESDGGVIATHAEPVWRAKTNYIVMADLTEHRLAGRREQMWARRLADGNFELCCLPFFTYGYSLGDVIAPRATGKDMVLGPVVTPSGRRLLRLAFHAHEPHHSVIHDAVERSRRPAEWFNPGYVAIDVADAIPDEIEEAIHQFKDAGDLHWETAGSTEGPTLSSRDLQRR